MESHAVDEHTGTMCSVDECTGSHMPLVSARGPRAVGVSWQCTRGCVEPCFKCGSLVSSVGALFQVWVPCFKCGCLVSSLGALFQVWLPCFKCGCLVSSVVALF